MPERRALLLAALAAAATCRAGAQARTGRIVAPFPPGGSTDILARLLAERLGLALQQPFVVDNRAGANGALGTDAVARAAPDGQTLLVTTNAAILVSPLLAKAAVDPSRVLQPVLQLVELELVLAVRQDMPAGTLDDFIALARRTPRGLAYASVGPGSLSHLAGEAFAMAAGVPLLHVPYKGAAPALADLLSGQVDCYFGTPPTFMEHVRAGKLRVLASTGAAPSPYFERLPRVADRFPGFDIVGWQGLFAPPATPAPVTAAIARHAAALLGEEPVQRRLAGLGMRVTALPGPALAALMERERRGWAQLIDKARIVV